jgi:hypothetical protein
MTRVRTPFKMLLHACCCPCCCAVVGQASAYFPEQLHEHLVGALLEYGEKQLVRRSYVQSWLYNQPALQTVCCLAAQSSCTADRPAGDAGLCAAGGLDAGLCAAGGLDAGLCAAGGLNAGLCAAGGLDATCLACACAGNVA